MVSSVLFAIITVHVKYGNHRNRAVLWYMYDNGSFLAPTVYVLFHVSGLFRFPEGSLYHTEGTWRLLRIGDAPLGFGEY